MNYQKFSLVFGFSVWLIATLIVRFWGQHLFLVENNLAIGFLFIIVLPTLYFLVQWVFNRFQLTPDAQVKSSLLMALPGMFCDIFCIKFHTIIFPLLKIEQVILLSVWVLWAYALVLLFGFIPKKEHK